MLNLDSNPSLNLDESGNPWSNKELFPEEELIVHKKKSEKLEKEVSDLNKEIQNLKKIK